MMSRYVAHSRCAYFWYLLLCSRIMYNIRSVEYIDVTATLTAIFFFFRVLDITFTI